jgi:hypothetical protein
MTRGASRLRVMQLVAVEAANHGIHAFHVGHDLHLTDVPMAHFAFHTGVEVPAMAPCDSRQDGVDANPWNGGFRFVIRRELLNARPVLSEGGMAFHACGGIRKSHQPPAIRIRVAELALQAQRQMSLVTIWERLLGRGKRHRSVMYIFTDRGRLNRLCVEGQA